MALIFGWIIVSYAYIDYILGSPQRSKSVQLEIPNNTSLKKVGHILQEHGLIRKANFFHYYAWLKGKKNIKAGSYEIAPNQDIDNMLTMFTKGQQNLVEVIIPPGFTVQQIAERLESRHVFKKEVFFEALRNRKPVYDFEKKIPIEVNRKYRLEGYLYPKNYYFAKNETADRVIDKMLAEFATMMSSLDAMNKLKQSNFSTDEWVTFASVLEKEVYIKEEHKIIAGVINNRLQKKQRLQVDATTIYAWSLRGREIKALSLNDLKLDSPFNTYEMVGLPIGPICSPDENALRAALSPQHHDYIFYVTRKDGSGKHYFSRTFEEHRRNIKLSEENKKKSNG